MSQHLLQLPHRRVLTYCQDHSTFEMAEDLEYSYVQAMKDSLVRACGEYRYKNGAFATAVTKTTSIIDDLNIIINSPLLATNEKKVFEQIKNIVISVRNMEAHGEKLDMLRISMEPIMAFDKVVSADMKLRGQYKPPTLAQIQGENGTVKETILIDDDGKVTCYKGGQPGVIPGAPQAFNEAQQKAQRTLVKDPDADSNVPPISLPKGRS